MQSRHGLVNAMAPDAARDPGALPGSQELHGVCDAAGLDSRDAVLLHARSNVVYHLPREGLVVRLATATPAQVDRAEKVVAVCRWLAECDGPSLAPTDLSQPVFAAGAVATIWPFLPASHMPAPADLGATLRDLHAITALPPPLPAYQPLIRLREALDLDTTRDAPALTADQHAWLTDHADQLQAAYQNLTSYLGEGLIHGDAHTENLLHDATADRWVLIDFDHAAHNPASLICSSPPLTTSTCRRSGRLHPCLRLRPAEPGPDGKPCATSAKRTPWSPTSAALPPPPPLQQSSPVDCALCAQPIPPSSGQASADTITSGKRHSPPKLCGCEPRTHQRSSMSISYSPFSTLTCNFVGRLGIEPRTQGLKVLCSAS